MTGEKYLRRRRRWLLSGLSGWMILAATAAVAAPRPNVVVLLTDDQRWDALGVVQRELGPEGRFPWLRTATPNMDRLAREGFRFRNAFVVSSLCSPSRAAFLTGRYNHLNGVVDNSTPFPVGATTYATALRAAGYRTGYFGKWHMRQQYARPGFDEHASFVGQGVYFDAPFLVNGAARATRGWVDDVSTGYAVDFIRRNAGRPFALVLGFKSPHGPHTPPPRLAHRFGAATPAPVANGKDYPPYDPSPAPADLPAEVVRNYFRTLVGVDENVGRVLRALDVAGLRDNTVVVFASDNGFLLGEHGVPGRVTRAGDKDGNKRSAYEPSMRIPLLVRYPKLQRRGVVVPATVLNIDLAPTLLDLAGLKPPASFQGRSWVPLLTGRATDLRDGFLYEYFREAGYHVPTLVALRRGSYKLVEYPGQPGWRQLFNLAQDPLERRNLIGDKGAQGVLRTMSSALMAQMRSVRYAARP